MIKAYNIFFAFCILMAFAGFGLGAGVEYMNNKNKPTQHFENGYIPRVYWEEACWSRALKRLQELEEYPSIINAKMLMGSRNPEIKEFHAWIEYTIKRGNEYSIISYDPSIDETVFVNKYTGNEK